MLIFATTGTKQTRTVTIVCVERKIKCDTGHRTQHTLGDAAAAQGVRAARRPARVMLKKLYGFLISKRR